MTIESDGTIRFNFRRMPPPNTRFSADAAVVEVRELYGCADIYFVSSGPIFRSVRQLVRVRLPLDQLRDQMKEDEKFFQGTRSQLAGVSVDQLWRPTLQELEKVADDRIANLDGTMLYMARHAQAAMIDVFRVAPDTTIRLQVGGTPEVAGQLRIELPTVVLYRLLIDIREGVRIEAESA